MALRSTRQDRVLLVAVWALTLVVLGVGIAILSPVLLLWGMLGLPGAIFLTWIHVRDTRNGSSSQPRPHGGAAEPTTDPTGAGDGVDVEKESPR